MRGKIVPASFPRRRESIRAAEHVDPRPRFREGGHSAGMTDLWLAEEARKRIESGEFSTWKNEMVSKLAVRL